MHFANNARCRNGASCKFPHVRLGPKEGVCRDFAVLGYCGKGLDCEHQHVRECPDFAATGVCPNTKCHLPHVIRAQHKKKTQPDSEIAAAPPQRKLEKQEPTAFLDYGGTFAKNDDFISLTFDESEDDEAEEDQEDEDAEEGSEDETEPEDAMDEDAQ